MPLARKRSLREAETRSAELPQPPSMLSRIRNMWQFANLFQFTVLFGKALKIDDNLDIEDLEMECLKPQSMALQDIGLSFLKFLSSHRGLTHDLFDEYSRRQFLAKAPTKNPFGDAEEPLKFAEFDIYKKIRVLQEMSQLIMMSPDRLRDKTEEQKDVDQTNWRIEPYGWDKEDRTYFVLDDNRIYRQTEADVPAKAPAPKTKASKKGRGSLRSSKRRRISTIDVSDAEDGGDERSEHNPLAEEPRGDGLGGMKWECVAVTLDEVQGFLASIQKTKDSNEKILRDQIQDHLVPILEKQEESRKRKIIQREKELLNLEKMAHAKRSSRLATKAESKKQEEQAREDERKRREIYAAVEKAEQQRLKLERERDNRLLSREKRLVERESRRRQHEEELTQLSEDSKSVGTGVGRMSERRLQAEIERNKQALKEIDDEEDDWIFDCVCGVYGQIDDGTHSVSCETCNVWQHSKCLSIAEEDADRDDFHFVCDPCRRREAEKERPRMIKIKINRPGSSSSTAPQVLDESKPARAAQEVAVRPESTDSSILSRVEPTTAVAPDFNYSALQEPLEKQPTLSATHQLGGTSSLSPEDRAASHPLSAPPTLSPPDQSPNKSRAYSTIHDQTSPIMSTDTRVPIGGKEQTQITSPIAGNGSSGSPSKQPLPPPIMTKKSPSLIPMPAPSARTPTGNSLAINTPSAAGSKLATPAASEGWGQESRHDDRSSPLPSSRGGLSPTKHSPQFVQHNTGHINGATNSTMNGIAPPAVATPKTTVLPPVAALSPSPRQQITTPPVKPAEPMKNSVHQPQPQGITHGRASFPPTPL